MEKLIKEACVEGFNQALRAQELGADRVELCENLAVGGTTPSLGTILASKKHLKIPVIVMIRPRGGNFVYNRYEMDIMADDIRSCLKAGADGIAIGILNKREEIDMPNLQKLVKLAGHMQVTFHKAIDVSADIEKEFMRLCESRLVHRVLTSGGASTALEGSAMLNRLIDLTKERLSVLVAGKVTQANLGDLRKLIPAREFHGKKIVGEILDLP